MLTFVSKLQFRILIADSTAAQFEELTVLVMAENEQEAFVKAQSTGLTYEDEFINNRSHKVCWRFEGITHLERLHALENGTVLFSELRDDYLPEQRMAIELRINKMKDAFTGSFLQYSTT